MLKIAEHKMQHVRSVASTSRAVISNQVRDSILKGNLIDNALYCLIKIFRGFTFCKADLPKASLGCTRCCFVLLLCLIEFHKKTNKSHRR